MIQGLIIGIIIGVAMARSVPLVAPWIGHKLETIIDNWLARHGEVVKKEDLPQHLWGQG